MHIVQVYKGFPCPHIPDDDGIVTAWNKQNQETPVQQHVQENHEDISKCTERQVRIRGSTYWKLKTKSDKEKRYV